MEERKASGPNLYFVGALCLFILGGVFFGLAVQSGEAEFGIFLIFPFVIGGGVLTGVGVLFILLGFVALMVGFVKGFTVIPLDHLDEDEEPRPRRKRKGKPRPRTRGDQEVGAKRIFPNVKGGGVVFIGPVPIVWGSNTKVTKMMLGLAIVVIIGLCLLFLTLSFGI